MTMKNRSDEELQRIVDGLDPEPFPGARAGALQVLQARRLIATQAERSARSGVGRSWTERLAPHRSVFANTAETQAQQEKDRVAGARRTLGRLEDADGRKYLDYTLTELLELDDSTRRKIADTLRPWIAFGAPPKNERQAKLEEMVQRAMDKKRQPDE